MKKTALVFAVAILFISGCGIDKAFRDDTELTTITGILTEQTENDAFSGTHIITGEGEVTPVRSLSINLSSNNYLDNKVKAIGFLNNDDGVFEITGISVVEALHEIEKKPVPVEYKNTDFGVQMKVYDNYDISETDSTIEFTATDGSTFQITQIPYSYEPEIDPEGNEVGSALQDYAKHTYPDMQDPDLNMRKIGVTPLDALYVEDSGNELYHLYRNGLIYTITIHYSKNADKDTEKNFNEMLSYFKFTGFTTNIPDSTDDESKPDETPVEKVKITTPDMKFSTFESLPHLFAGHYPASWYYAGSTGDADVIRHYGFSDEPVTGDNELISLDVISTEIPTGSTIVTEDNKTLTVIQSGGKYTVYTSLDKKTFRISGNDDYKDIILYMAESLFPITEEL